MCTGIDAQTSPFAKRRFTHYYRRSNGYTSNRRQHRSIFAVFTQNHGSKDAEEIFKLPEKGIHIDESIVDDAYNFFKSVADYSRSQGTNTKWQDTISSWKIKYSNETAREPDSVAYSTMKSIFTAMPDESIVITDIGSNMVWTLQSLQLKPGQRLFSNFVDGIDGRCVTSCHWRCDWK